MKHSRLTQVIACALIGYAGGAAHGEPAATMPAAPVGVLIEAEQHAGSDSKVVDDAAASGKKAVENGKAWQPLAVVPVPVDAATQVTVFIRHRGGPIQLKTLDDAGKQTERDWVWATPAEWTWTRVGRFTKADLGATMLFMRGEGEAAVAIDAVVLADKDAAALPVLPPDSPDASKAYAVLNATVDFATPIAAITPLAWGVNDYEVHDPAAAADPQFNTALARISPPLIRIHRGDFPKQWLDAEEKAWDVARIRESLRAVRAGYGDAQIMLNFASWPARMSRADGTLDTAHWDAYAALCVELMRILRDDVGQRIDYWEVLNEKDDLYERAGRLDELWAVYNHVAKAMKAFDRNARVGGPAFTWAKPRWVEGFVANCLPNTDFVTYHNYGVGDIYDSNELLMSRLDAFEEHARFIRKTVDAASPGRRVPILLDEYNVKWTWDPMERRHGNAVGAAFQAAVVRRASLAGIDGLALWHFKGDAYGLIDAKDVPRLTYSLFEWGPKYLVGKAVRADTSDPAAVELLAVDRGAGGRAVLVIAKSSSGAQLPSAIELLGADASAKPTLRQVTCNGTTESLVTDPSAPLRVPGYSVTLLTLDP